MLKLNTEREIREQLSVAQMMEEKRLLLEKKRPMPPPKPLKTKPVSIFDGIANKAQKQDQSTMNLNFANEQKQDQSTMNLNFANEQKQDQSTINRHSANEKTKIITKSD